MSSDTPKPITSEALDQRTIAEFSAAIAPVAIEPAVVARLHVQIQADIAGSGTDVVRQADGKWRALLQGVEVKILHVDRGGGTQTALWRLMPGARIPPHSHLKEEECLVLEGSVVNEDISYLKGDYLYTDAGSEHSEFVSPYGALLLVRNELLPSP
ncbi:MAG TPA: cupin domain-containing protein [Steroidobacteraceae bacterium]|jgi:anti-sigma factor ChrR (cupin superfamily)|nr:cupin domain-containing protein [Steroidobacteraceae bacterium]